MDLISYIQAHISEINRTLETLVPENNLPHNTLFQAARYALIGPGKRIRPLLTLATVQILQGNLSNALEPACAIELIHTYSLIHDDLPCMDNDDFRRGKPTLHKVFPEGHALLTGDFLLTFAFELLATAPKLSDKQKIKLIQTLAERSGSDGMIGGQALDIEAAEKEMDPNALSFIHQLKTGALITASIEFGGILGHADEAQMDILRQFGNAIGLAFQIIDDIQDITMSE